MTSPWTTRPLAIGLCCCLFALLGACSEEPEVLTSVPSKATDQAPDSVAREAGDQEPRYWFVDASKESGLEAFQQINGTGWKDHILEAMGGGVALFDYDLDGDLDVYLANGGEFHADMEQGIEVRDALFANDGAGHFTDVTQQAKLGDTEWTNGVSVVDYNADGLPDLYLTNFGPNALLRNMGDGTFRDVSREAHVRGQRWSTGSCFVDFDRDGDLDLYVSNYIVLKKAKMLEIPDLVEYEGLQVMRGPLGMPPQQDLFYINEGDGVYREASEEVGLVEEPGFGFQIALIDYDRDGWMDLYVANDSVPNYLWHNQKNGTFVDRALEVGLSVSNMGIEQAGMGIGVGDYDGDLRDDLFVTNFSRDYSTLYHGISDSLYRDVTRAQNLGGLTHSDVSWGCGFHDFDNDGDDELYAVNGHVYSNIDENDDDSTSYAQLNYMFEFNGKTFQSPVGAGGPGFGVMKVSRGSAVGDIDGDGDLDIVISNLDSTPTLLRNESVNNNNWVFIDLLGDGQNLDAIGARVVVRAGELAQARTQASSHGFLSSSDLRMHFGLGQAKRVDSVEVTWPDGTLEVFKDLPVCKTVKLEKGKGK